jgi:hypothetical protein
MSENKAMLENVEQLPIQMSCAAALATANSSSSGLNVKFEIGRARSYRNCEYSLVRFKPTNDIIYLKNQAAVRYSSSAAKESF